MSLHYRLVLHLCHYRLVQSYIYVITLHTTPRSMSSNYRLLIHVYIPIFMLLSDKLLHYICVLLHSRLLPFIWPLVTDMLMLWNVCWITRRTSHSETLTAITALIWPSTTTNRESACTSLRDLIPFFWRGLVVNKLPIRFTSTFFSYNYIYFITYGKKHDINYFM